MIDTEAVRNKILNYAFQGKLISQAIDDYSVKKILEKCKLDKEQAIKEGKCKKETFRGALKISEYPFDIPESWAFVYISDMALFQEGPGILGKDFREEGVPLIRIAGMQGNTVSKMGCNYLDPDMVAKKWNHFKLDVGDIVISTSASLDKIAEVEEDTAGCIAYTGLIRFKMYGGIDKEYFKYFIKSPFYTRQIENQITGVAISHYGPTHLKKMVIPIPPLAEQNKIVSELDTTFNELKLIDDLQQQYANNITSLNKKILDLAVRGKLVPQDPNDEPASVLLKKIAEEKKKLIKEGKIKKQKPLPAITEDEIPFDIPESWEWVRIGTIFNLQAGKNKTASEIYQDQTDAHEYPCFGGNGRRGFVKEFNRDGFYPLIGRQGALCGNINFANGKFYATEHAVIVETFAETNVLWSGYFLKILNLNQYATATAQPGLSVANINNVLIPVPPAEEQKRIVEMIDTMSVMENSVNTQ